MTRFSLWQQVVHCGVAAQVVATLAPVPFGPFSGFLFLLIGPLILLAAGLLQSGARAPAAASWRAGHISAREMARRDRISV